jgi:serine/threonine-protein kinase
VRPSAARPAEPGTEGGESAGARSPGVSTIFQPGLAFGGEERAAPERIDRYEIVSRLGRGSMGEVYLAHDPNTDRRVALKLIAAPAAEEEEAGGDARTRFLLEARAAGRLHHPGIVVLHDADTDAASGRPYLVMEWVAGRSLAAILRETKPLPWRRAVEIAARVAAALAHAHERGIVHRDVKPANVLVGEDGAVKVSDFGIAKFVAESHTLAGQLLGTPDYMSPEQVRGDAVDGRSDLFAVGAILHEMLSGEAPFHADSIAGITHRIAFVEPRPLPRAGEELPVELEAVVRRALDKNPEARFQTGRELAAALEALLGAPAAGGVTGTPGSVPLAAAARPDRRRVATSALARRAGLLAAALLLIGAAAFWLAGVAGGPAAPVAAGDGATAPAGGPAAPAPGTTRAASPAPSASATATLELRHANRLRNASITVRVDGTTAWSSPLHVRRGFLDRFSGDEVRASIPVAPGVRRIEIRIVHRGAGIDSRGELRSRFEAGRTRRLRVVLLPYATSLRLEWEP